MTELAIAAPPVGGGWWLIAVMALGVVLGAALLADRARARRPGWRPAWEDEVEDVLAELTWFEEWELTAVLRAGDSDVARTRWLSYRDRLYRAADRLSSLTGSAPDRVHARQVEGLRHSLCELVTAINAETLPVPAHPGVSAQRRGAVEGARRALRSDLTAARRGPTPVVVE